MSAPTQLTEIDELIRREIPHLTDEDNCYFLREYTKWGGYQASETNSLILNFKTKPEHQGNPQRWRWKGRAIRQIAHELQAVIQDTPPLVLVTWIPPSKTKDHEEYDDRLEQLAHLLCEPMTNCECAELIRQIQSTEPLHHGGLRDPETIAANYELVTDQLPQRCKGVLVLDDVITTGAHFRAVADVLTEAFPKTPIAGVFVARAIED